jgi:predicted nucleotide-binding protein
MGASKSVLVLSSSVTELQAQLISMLKEIGIDGIIFQRQTTTDGVVSFLEKYSDVKYAYYLFTKADINNAMFELGYLVGKVGAGRICCIHQKDDAPPKGIPGINYKEIIYKLEEISFGLMKDLKAAGYTVSL